MNDELTGYCKRLRLGKGFVDNAKNIQADTHMEFLLMLLKAEVSNRESLRREKLLTSAGFYSIKTFSEFKDDEITLPSGITIENLKNLDFIKTNTNLVLYGNVGTGKTFLTTAIGVEACKRGISTKFFRTAALVNQLSEAKKEGSLSSFIKKLLKADLILLDELGYIPLDRTGAQLLFEVISQCYEQKSLVINTNIEFSRWVNIFYDEQMTSAILDRLLHHCHLILFDGPSIRMQESSLFRNQ
jgi:DNA replication protein DnaC